ncbi:hypothetical protein ACPOL_6811 (plasmid) [Acidisarcina polymorpha]|uniref:Uncharacterized protein n=1 Tax=Acidisarcina polymorpha TaxID=2211140 RepID=A0A2Z5GA50_9BACT|nr:hypothetical protein ACPOL_6811 [Acidisarcina polymorpha]
MDGENSCADGSFNSLFGSVNTNSGVPCVILGFALLLKMGPNFSRTGTKITALLQAVGIGFLLPLPGFLLLVLGELPSARLLMEGVRPEKAKGSVKLSPGPYVLADVPMERRSGHTPASAVHSSL